MGCAPRSPGRARLISKSHSMRTTKPVALVTGGAKGIGRAIAHQLVSTGWQVGIIDLPDSGVRRAYARERSIFVIDGDVRDEKTISDAVDGLVHRFHRLDGIVSNAGIMIRKPLRHLTLPEWQRVDQHQSDCRIFIGARGRE